jgi:hypothetical protein
VKWNGGRDVYYSPLENPNSTGDPADNSGDSSADEHICVTAVIVMIPEVHAAGDWGDEETKEPDPDHAETITSNHGADHNSTGISRIIIRCLCRLGRL